MSGVDVLLVGLGSTAGLRAAEEELAASLRRAGATVVAVSAGSPPEVRTFALTDLTWALAARAVAKSAIREHQPRSIVYSTTTAALLWPRPGAIRYDAPAAANRPGRHGLWQRPLERRRLRAAPLLLPQTQGTLDETPGRCTPAVIVPIPVEPSRGQAGRRDHAAITYAANWHKKGLDRVLAAWALARQGEEELVIAGASASQVAVASSAAGLAVPPPGIVVHDLLAPDAYRELLRRSRVYVTAPRREDYGVAQLEALVDGCALVTTDAPGPYAAVPLARAIDPRWVVPDDAGAPQLAVALRCAIDDAPADLEVLTRAAVAPFRRDAVDEIVARDVLPVLLG